MKEDEQNIGERALPGERGGTRLLDTADMANYAQIPSLFALNISGNDFWCKIIQ